jgi:hypothetical protein
MLQKLEKFLNKENKKFIIKKKKLISETNLIL